MLTLEHQDACSSILHVLHFGVAGICVAVDGGKGVRVYHALHGVESLSSAWCQHKGGEVRATVASNADVPGDEMDGSRMDIYHLGVTRFPILSYEVNHDYEGSRLTFLMSNLKGSEVSEESFDGDGGNGRENPDINAATHENVNVVPSQLSEVIHGGA